MFVSVVGAGYVGLVTAAALAELGHHVVCVDADASRIGSIRAGRLPITEPTLDELVATHQSTGRLTFSTRLADTRGTALVLVAVGTLGASGEWSGAAVRSVCHAIATDRGGPRTIVIRSTLLPGTARVIAEELGTVDPRVELALNPEFTREGTAVSDFLSPDRIVLGADAAPRAVALLSRLYAPLSDTPMVTVGLTEAEMIKVAANVFLAVKIGFANEIARLAWALDADAAVVLSGVGADERIGRRFLVPGPGYGGSCLPTQARALPALAEDLGISTPVLASAAASNGLHLTWVARLVEEAAGQRLVGTRRVALLGLTFKAGTDDLRESPALALARHLRAGGMHLTAYDPAVAAGRSHGMDVARTAQQACMGADVVVVATEWPEFARLDWTALRGVMRGYTVVDTRGVVDGEAVLGAGLVLRSMTGSKPPVRQLPLATTANRAPGRLVAAEAGR